MIILCILIVTGSFVFIKFVLNILVYHFGKITYNGFSAAGFQYHSEKELFYSVKNAWQKNFGYCHLYDVIAPIFRMIIDTEPIRFYYNGKNWLITFWKGQYGIVTGAEVGIYNTYQQTVNKKTIYMPVKQNELLDIELALYKNNQEIMRAKSKHWWLAIFKLGMFSKPKKLTVDISIKFLDQQMLMAFINSFKKLGYKEKDYRIRGNTFYFTFKHPKTKKVWTRSWFFDSIRQHHNYKNVKRYNRYLIDVIDYNGDKKSEKHLVLQKLIPDFLKNSKDYKIEKVNQSINNKSKVYLHDTVYSNMRDNYE